MSKQQKHWPTDLLALLAWTCWV